MLNGISINRAPINSRGNVGAAERMSVSAGAGVSATVTLAKQSFISAKGSCGISTAAVALLKVKYLGASGKCGVTKVVTDMDLFKFALSQTITYLSVSSTPSASQNPAAILKVDGFMSVTAGAGVSNTSVGIAVQRALSANGMATAAGFETGFFSNAYMSVGANLNISVNVSFQNARGLATSGASATVSAAAIDVSRVRGLSASGSATVSGSEYLGKAQPLGAAGSATVSASQPGISKLKFFSVTATATVAANVSIGVNIFASAPSQRIIHVPPSPRVVYVPLAPRQSQESQH